MSVTSADQSCGQCGREVSAIAGCPERPEANCPFVVRRNNPILIFFLISVLLALATLPALDKGDDYWVLWLPVACSPIAFGLCAISRVIQLYDTQSHTQLRCVTLAGIELSRRWTTSGRLLPIHFELSQPLTYPLSITALAAVPNSLKANRTEAVSLFRAALVELLANECIEVYLHQSHAFSRWGHTHSAVDHYIVVAAQKTQRAETTGVLERGIMRALHDWSVKPESPEWPEWPEGPPIYDLVRAVYEGDRSDPEQRLAKLVADDAVARHLGRIEGSLFWKTIEIEWDTGHIAGLQQGQRVLQSVSQQIDQMYPEFSRKLDLEISRAISSVIPQSGN